MFARVFTIKHFLIFAAIIAFHSPKSFAIEMKGVSYAGWWEEAYLTEDSDESLATARQAGCAWVAINLWWFQDTISSTEIYPDYSWYSVSPESVIHAINRCHELGMKVMLKPNVDPKDGHWRGEINPSAEWFEAYTEFINYWADIAEANGVELFCVGCELINTTGWSSSWRDVIEDVRTHYTGPLVYAANHGNEQSVTWWDVLDYIGIDAYYPLTSKNDPTLAELKSAWNSRANNIENWRNYYWPTKQVIFTEVGYTSTDGTNRTPWDYSGSAPLDLQEQADCYEALLSQLHVRDWWMGPFWWNWETDPNAGGPTNKSHTPQNKPAEQVMSNYYLVIPGDFDDDWDVDLTDLQFMTDYWLDSGVIGIPDLNNDQEVNLLDFAILADHWFEGVD